MNKMIDENIFRAIMTLPSKKTTLLLMGINILTKYVKVELKTNESGSVYYVADLDKLMKSDITQDELTELRNGDWSIENDKIIKYLK